MYSEDTYSVSKCHNVTKPSEFYLRQLRFNVTSTDNAGCLKNSSTMVFQTLLSGVTKTFTLKGVQTIHLNDVGR
jgi:hypothetical protein